MSGSGTTSVHEDTVGAARIVTIVRPDKKNAIDARTAELLASAIERASADPLVRGVILASCDDVFLAGGDIGELAALPRTEKGADAVLAIGRRLDAIDASTVPVLAAISGDVYGGGCEVVLACDEIIVEPHVRFAFRHAAMGLCPAWGGTARLVDRVGSQAASRLLFTAEPFDASEALRIGFASEVAAPGAALERALERIVSIARADRTVIAEQRRLIRATAASRPARDLETAAFRKLWGGAAHVAAMERFAARRARP